LRTHQLVYHFSIHIRNLLR